MPPGVYLMPDAMDPLRLSGTVFVRQGPYAPGVFRFSVQFTIQKAQLVLPIIFFPPILIHPIVEPASGRVNMLPYLSMAAQQAWTTHPEEPQFLACLAHYLQECFSLDFCAALKEQWILNEYMWEYVGLLLTISRLFHTDHILFERLAAQSASLSMSSLALYDTQSGSGIPGDLDVTRAPITVMPFEELPPEQVKKPTPFFWLHKWSDLLLLPMSPADAIARRPRRKRARKVRTAIVSSSDDSSDDEKPAVKSSSDSSSDSSDSEVSDAQISHNFDEEPDNDRDLDLDDEYTQEDTLEAPKIPLPSKRLGDSEPPGRPRTMVGGRLSTMTSTEISHELLEKQRDTFRSLYMQALTEEFDDELDALRQHDPLLVDDTSTSAATGRMALLIDALSFGYETLADSKQGKKDVDQVALALS
ncbi:hypothetical protein MCAP1_000061 [Malassezia caprae]|uniref:Ribosome assembly protein 3 n=1 Tax=Malassezia caprae TaxID=1381934 RepID=A0AAF0E842_9BASI|nr:hypothetical protein MCAP1_000061 [Malassezia caprae]